VIIRDLDVGCLPALVRPLEAHTPLVVDANAVLTFPIAAESLEAVPRREAEIVELCRGVEPVQCNVGTSLRNTLK